MRYSDASILPRCFLDASGLQRRNHHSTWSVKENSLVHLYLQQRHPSFTRSLKWHSMVVLQLHTSPWYAPNSSWISLVQLNKVGLPGAFNSRVSEVPFCTWTGRWDSTSLSFPSMQLNHQVELRPYLSSQLFSFSPYFYFFHLRPPLLPRFLVIFDLEATGSSLVSIFLLAPHLELLLFLPLRQQAAVFAMQLPQSIWCAQSSQCWRGDTLADWLIVNSYQWDKPTFMDSTDGFVEHLEALHLSCKSADFLHCCYSFYAIGDSGPILSALGSSQRVTYLISGTLPIGFPLFLIPTLQSLYTPFPVE